MKPDDDEFLFRPAGEADHDSLADLLSHSFGFPREDAKGWFARPGTALRVFTKKVDQALAGGLLEIPMGQFFGGRSVSTMGVAGVGIANEVRGRGVGAKMMVAMLRDARSQGFALSSLYPATLDLYRRAGYERAGAHYAGSFDPRNFEVPRVPDVSITEIKNASEKGVPPDLRALYRSNAARATGYLDRGEYIWSRVTNPRGLVTKTFSASHNGKLEGYVALAHVMGGDESKVTVTDLVATTKRSAAAILRLLIEYRSLATAVKWKGHPSDLFTNLLPERHYQFVVTDAFMIRVVDVDLALTMRGYPRFAQGTVTFDVDDASMPENSGSYGVTVEDGKAIVTRAKSTTNNKGGMRVSINERGLASLYSGHSSPHVLAAAGLLEADEDTLGTLGGWFSGPYPSTPDFF
jgi:predicted acetyltransferase